MPRQAPSSDNPETSEWGPHFWYAMRMGARRPSRPMTDQDVERLKDFYMSLVSVLPCETCSNHYREILERRPLTERILRSKPRLCDWVEQVRRDVDRIVYETDITPSEARLSQLSRGGPSSYQESPDYASGDEESLKTTENSQRSHHHHHSRSHHHPSEASPARPRFVAPKTYTTSAKSSAASPHSSRSHHHHSHTPHHRSSKKPSSTNRGFVQKAPPSFVTSRETQHRGPTGYPLTAPMGRKKKGCNCGR